MSIMRKILLIVLLSIITAIITPILLCVIFIYKIVELLSLVPCLFGFHYYEQIGEYVLKCKRCNHIEVI